MKKSLLIMLLPFALMAMDAKKSENHTIDYHEISEGEYTLDDTYEINFPYSGETIYGRKITPNNSGAFEVPSDLTKEVKRPKDRKHKREFFDADGNIVKIKDYKKRNRIAKNKKTGKFCKNLSKKCKRLNDADSINVIVWINTKTLKRNKGKFKSKKIKKRIARLMGKTFSKKEIKRILSSETPFFEVKVTKKQLFKLKHSKLISFVERSIETPFETDLLESAQYHRLDAVRTHYGLEGNGITVAVWEMGYPHDIIQLDQPIVARHQIGESWTIASPHITQVIGAVNNNRAVPENGLGFAPQADIVVANFNNVLINRTTHASDALQWAFHERNGGARFINQSWRGEANDDWTAHQSAMDRVADYYAFWTGLGIFQAAGNQGMNTSHYVGHKAYNTIIVGEGWGNQIDGLAGMAAYSSHRNGYFGEAPHITMSSPNGTSIYEGRGKSQGTSFASPKAAGLAASLASGNSYGSQQLAIHAWSAKAILMAASYSITGNSWYQDRYVDQMDGAGTPDAWVATQIVEDYNPANTYTTDDGWGLGYINDRNTNYHYVWSTYKGPIQACLSWKAELSSLSDLSYSTSDLDISVWDSYGNRLASSTKWNDTAECIDFEGLPGRAYRIHVYNYRQGTGGYIPNTHYALAIGRAIP